MVHRFRRRLPSASLAALRPSSASLKSMQTWSASAMQTRHTRGLSSASSVKHEDFGGCARASGFNYASGISAGKSSDIKCRVFNSGELRGQVNRLRRRRVNEPESDATGCIWDWPTRKDRYPFVLKSDQQDKIKDKISGCPHRTNGWVATIQDLDYIL